jgi:hypothetical protein
MGLVLAGGLLLVAAPMTAVALHTGGRPLLPGAIRRRGGTPAALVAAATGTPSGAVPEVGAVEQPVVEIDVEAPAVAVRRAYDTAGPRQAAATPGSGTS